MTLLKPPRVHEQPVPDSPQRPVVFWRARVAVACLVLTAIAFLQDPGRIASDTKLDLVVSPWGFLARSLNLWDPQGFFGQLQNQAYGYLWPMGPFFGIGHSIGLPEWVIQRLWWSLLLCLAFLGIYKLAALLGIGTPWTRIAAGFAYALAVRPQSGIGAVSVEIWPMAIAPWVLVPLVIGSRRGSPARWAALSALAVATAGGVNAVAAGAVLPLGAWFLITRTAGPRKRRLALWWSACVALAITWWLVPLIILGKYSPPFLDWIESTYYTTLMTTPVRVLSGANHWVAYLGTVSDWTAGWALATQPLLIVATGIVAATGVAGLALRGMPERTFLVGGLLAGFTLVSLGRTGVAAGLGSEQIQVLLDGVLAPLRNLHKFDLLMRIPIVLGFAYVLAKLRWDPARWRTWVVPGVVGCALVLSMSPALTGQLTRDRSYVQLADYWDETAFWLDEVGKPGRALIVPGASFSELIWGRPQDEPLQALSSYPWGVRDAVPLSSAGNIRMLDAVEERLQSGVPSAGLAAYLSRQGVQYLVVRNDLVPAAQAPPPVVLHQVLENSTGINRVAFFGPVLGRTVPNGSDTEAFVQPYPAVEIYEVTPSNEVENPLASLRPVAATRVADGAPEAALAMADLGIAGTAPVVLEQDTTNRDAPLVVTDTDRRREITFGYTRNNESLSMTADEEFKQRRGVHDYRVSNDPAEVPATEPLWTFDSSSSASDVDALLRTPRGGSPAAAVDGDLDTYWTTGSLQAERPMWAVDFGSPKRLPDRLAIRLQDKGWRAQGTVTVQVDTDNGSVVTELTNTSGPQRLAVPGGDTDHLRIEGLDDTRFGITELDLPQTILPARLELPKVPAGASVLLTARRGDATECVTRDGVSTCSPSRYGFGQDRAGLFRVLDLEARQSMIPRILVSARDGRDLIPAGAGVSVQVSSTRTQHPAAGASAAFDGLLGTSWQAGGSDADPTVRIAWGQPRSIRGIRLITRSGLNASSPLEVRLRVGSRVVTGFTDERGLLRFDPVVADRLELEVVSTNTIRARSIFGEQSLPVGISEIAVLGADDLRVGVDDQQRLEFPCGTGPTVRIDGRSVLQTSVSTTVAELRASEPVLAQPCGRARLTMTKGRQTVDVVASTEFRPVSAALLSDKSLLAPTGLPESPEIVTWEPTQRELVIAGSGEARYLEIPENFNAGWTATVAGRELEPIRLEGWKQGFIVPAGTTGTADVSYVPDTGYKLGLGIGAVGVLAVVLIALFGPGRTNDAPVFSRAWPRALVVLAILATALAMGWIGLAGFAAAWYVLGRLRPPAFTVVAGGMGLAVGVQALSDVRPGAAASVTMALLIGAALAAVSRSIWDGHDGRSAGPAVRSARTTGEPSR